MKKRGILLSSLLVLVFIFALGAAGASAEDVTWNPNDKGAKVILSNNNLTAQVASNGSIRATEGKKNYGKWYWEITWDYANFGFIGIANKNAPIDSQSSNTNYVRLLYYNGNLAPVNTSYNKGFVIGETVGVALDLDNGTISFYKKGVNCGVAFSDLSSLGEVYPFVTSGTNRGDCTANFGATPFAYPIPEGYQPYNGSQEIIQAPTNLIATAGDTQASLSWTGIEDATSYNIKRSLTTGGPYETVGSSVYAEYTDTGLTNGTTYYYVVTAIIASGESANSNEASVTPQQGATPPTGNGTLIVTVANNANREYNLTMSEIQAFIDWYNNRSTGGNVYVIEKPAISPYIKTKDYLIFDKIVAWEVKEY